MSLCAVLVVWPAVEDTIEKVEETYSEKKMNANLRRLPRPLLSHLNVKIRHVVMMAAMKVMTDSPRAARCRAKMTVPEGRGL